ncbi:putative Short-chain dehydrogenase TIC 32, chloroplastic [Glarea lozoyensis 74030]|uniref:Putative Short-chain dehydrogenase TIC 32, chloroplastic n=1 Tax=Glarea lozoyensis (strain ATCC 74030 / MF5533) TaxID=1104152 RepID=H0EI84_GLAL7|nr:putative Short-chain dehydrogenase TIC 32, chloroplastic [Glarea lozoyensis 74030]
MSRYAEAHKNPAGPGDARPTALQIIKDEGVEGKLVGKVIVITGTSSGIGIETARALALTGARLFLVARDLGKAEKALEGIYTPGKDELIEMDNTSLGSVRTAAKTILEKSNNQVNILINNAGIMAVPDLQYTKDGHELQFGLLKPALLASSSKSLSSRVINVSSSAHHMAGLNKNSDYNFNSTEYTPYGSYGQSKTANIYMANEIERRYGSKGLHATSLHPGMIQTNLMQFLDPEVVQGMLAANPGIENNFKSPEQGAATTIWAAIGKEWEDKGGEYLFDVAKTELGKESGTMLAEGYADYAYDEEAEARLWKDSLKIVGLTDSA